MCHEYGYFRLFTQFIAVCQTGGGKGFSGDNEVAEQYLKDTILDCMKARYFDLLLEGIFC